MSYRLCCFFILLLLSSNIGLSQNTFIPDDNFEQALIDLGLDTGLLDDFVPTANITGVTSLTIDNRNIQDLTGIEDFTALSQLFVQGNLLTTIDLRNNQNLQIFWCFNNLLPEIDVSNNLNLISLRCEGNDLTNLDISKNPLLNVLTCENNRLSTLEISSNPQLNRLICSNNLLRTLDVNENPLISQLSCDGNELSVIDVSNNLQINILNCANNFITELDTSLQSELIELNCSNNQLCYLNINNGNNNDVTLMNFSGNPDLTCVVVDNVNVSYPIWIPNNFANYVASINDCNARVPVDNLNDFIGSSYVLPALINGSFYTNPGANGVVLNAGDVITSSQTIYIYNSSNCFSNESSFDVIISENPYFIPRYFTPNNDGINDFWKVIDVDNNINNISIYSRYGKLLKFLASTSQSWDGTYNGQYLPTDSYWYEIVLNNRDILRGYFTLKR